MKTGGEGRGRPKARGDAAHGARCKVAKGISRKEGCEAAKDASRPAFKQHLRRRGAKGAYANRDRPTGYRDTAERASQSAAQRRLLSHLGSAGALRRYEGMTAGSLDWASRTSPSAWSGKGRRGTGRGRAAQGARRKEARPAQAATQANPKAKERPHLSRRSAVARTKGRQRDRPVNIT